MFFLIVYKTVETNSFWIYEAKVLLLGGKLLTMTLKLKTKSQIMQFLSLSNFLVKDM